MHLNTSYLVLSTLNLWLNVFKCAHFGSLQCDLKISWWHILEILEPKKKNTSWQLVIVCAFLFFDFIDICEYFFSGIKMKWWDNLYSYNFCVISGFFEIVDNYKT